MSVRCAAVSPMTRGWYFAYGVRQIFHVRLACLPCSTPERAGNLRYPCARIYCAAQQCQFIDANMAVNRSADGTSSSKTQISGSRAGPTVQIFQIFSLLFQYLPWLSADHFPGPSRLGNRSKRAGFRPFSRRRSKMAHLPSGRLCATRRRRLPCAAACRIRPDTNMCEASLGSIMGKAMRMPSGGIALLDRAEQREQRAGILGAAQLGAARLVAEHARYFGQCLQMRSTVMHGGEERKGQIDRLVVHRAIFDRL
jgi:hypothetical protein